MRELVCDRLAVYATRRLASTMSNFRYAQKILDTGKAQMVSRMAKQIPITAHRQVEEKEIREGALTITAARSSRKNTRTRYGRNSMRARSRERSARIYMTTTQQLAARASGDCALQDLSEGGRCAGRQEHHVE